MLELQSICKKWQARNGETRLLLDNLSLVVRPRETVAILGPSGSGKSTLLKIVAGLEALDSGHIRFDGQDITGMPPERRRFALMFQDFALFPHLSVQDNVAFGLVERGVSQRESRVRALNMLAQVGMARHALSKVWQLSGGEQQRVALARALITEPRVLLLDEPFSALDAELRLQLRSEFGQRIAASQTATLWVTHDEAEARAVAQRGYKLVNGGLQPLW